MSKFKFLLLNNVKLKIGFLGGSFNPPHIGHVHISLQTLKRLNLSHIYWLLTPCSPAKDKSTYADFAERFQKCLDITKQYNNKIDVLDIEKFFRNFYSSNTIREIKKIHPMIEIYWIIGCDNALQLHTWHRWKDIFSRTKVVVCERSEMSIKIHNARISHNYCCKHIYDPSNGYSKNAKEFIMLHMKKLNISSTELRNESKQK